MRIVGSNYESGRKQSSYYYRLHDSAPTPEPGDWLLAETREVTFAIEVIDETEYAKRTCGQDPTTLPEIKYVIDRAPERLRAEQQRRVKELRNTLVKLHAAAAARKALEEQAAAGGDEGKAVLAELDKLEAELAS